MRNRVNEVRYSIGLDATADALVAAKRKPLLDALDHIVRVCKGSRSRTRRIRYIEEVAVAAIEGRPVAEGTKRPKNSPTVLKVTEVQPPIGETP